MKVLENSIDYVESNIGVTPEYIIVNDLYDRFKLKANFTNRDSTSFRISPGAELYDMYTQFFSSVRDSIDVSDGSQIRSYSLSSYSQTNTDMLEDWEFYTSDKSDFKVGVYVEADFSVIDQERIYSAVIDEIQSSHNITVEKRNIPDFRALFSDMKPLRLQTVRGSLYTAFPHLFYKSVDSLDKFISTVGDDRSVSETEYKVDFILDPVEDSSGKLRSVFESELQKAVSKSVSIPYDDYMIEGEAICVGESLYQSEGDCVFYYIKIPVTDGQLFKEK